MNWLTGFVVYFLIWWTILFAVLPWGVRREENPEPGHDPGAPARPMLWKKVGATTVVRANRDILIADVDPAPTAANASAKGEIAQSGGAVSYGRGFVAGRARSGANFGDGTYTLSDGTLMQDTVDPENQANWNHIGTYNPGFTRFGLQVKNE